MEQSNEIRDLDSDHFLTSGGEGGGSFNLYTWVFKKIIQWSFIHSKQLLNSVPEVKCHKVQINLKKSLNQPESIYNMHTCVCVYMKFTLQLWKWQPHHRLCTGQHCQFTWKHSARHVHIMRATQGTKSSYRLTSGPRLLEEKLDEQSSL